MMLDPRDSVPPPPPSGMAGAVPKPLLNERSALLGVIIPFMVSSWIFYALRLYVRLVLSRAPGWDDLFMFLSMVSTTVASIILCIAADFGLGGSIYTMSPSEVKNFMRLLYISVVPYPTSATFIRIALLFQYLRIFETGSKYRSICKFMIAVVSLWGVVFCILTWVPCYPVSAYWDITNTDAACWGFASRDSLQSMNTFVSHAISTTILDFIVFIIPVHLYFKPDAGKKMRHSLIALFILGLTVNLCSLWRMAYIIKMDSSGAFDPAWYSPTISGLFCIEGHLAVFCAALPVFWPVLKTAWNRIFVTTEVTVIRTDGPFIQPQKSNDIEVQSVRSDHNLEIDPAQMPESWEPFVGDEATGLGESETVITSPAAARLSRKVKRLFQR